MSCKFSVSVQDTCKWGLLEIHTSQGQCLAPAVNELFTAAAQKGVCEYMQAFYWFTWKKEPDEGAWVCKITFPSGSHAEWGRAYLQQSMTLTLWECHLEKNF